MGSFKTCQFYRSLVDVITFTRQPFEFWIGKIAAGAEVMKSNMEIFDDPGEVQDRNK